MNDRNQQQQAPKTAINDPKLKLYAPPLPGANQAPSLEPGYASNHPFLLVRTNFPNDKDYGRIKAGLDMPAFMETLGLIEKVVHTSDECSYTMENKNKPWSREQGGRVKEAILETTTIVGRDKEGRVFIAILHYDKSRPKVIFHFGSRMYHSITRRGGEITAAEQSNSAALAWVHTLRQLMPVVASQHYVNKTMDPSKGGGNNRSSNSFSRGGNDNETSGGSSDFDDGLPF
jgi:hypothetical protein